jgi:hypothetical protein
VTRRPRSRVTAPFSPTLRRPLRSTRLLPRFEKRSRVPSKLAWPLPSRVVRPEVVLPAERPSLVAAFQVESKSRPPSSLGRHPALRSAFAERVSPSALVAEAFVLRLKGPEPSSLRVS